MTGQTETVQIEQPFEIKYDVPIEVTKEQYTAIMTYLAGVCAGREESGKCYIKVWVMGYAKRIQRFLDAKVVNKETIVLLFK